MYLSLFKYTRKLMQIYDMNGIDKDMKPSIACLQFEWGI